MSIRVFASVLSVGAVVLAGPAGAQMRQMVLPSDIAGPGVSGPLSEPQRVAAPAAAAPASPAPASPAAAEPAPAVAAPAKPKVTAKPIPTVTLTNASGSTATEVVVSSSEMTIKLDKPLASKNKASLRLPKLKGCVVSVAATFEGEGQVDVGEFNVCKDKAIRFTD